jgi:nitroreductase
MSNAAARVADYPIDKVFLERWSPRSFTDDAITKIELMTMLEAGRWAASSFNAQPWRFLYALRNTQPWATFLNLLIPFNQSWAKDAAALVVLVSNSLTRTPGTDVDVPSYSHSLDAGAAAANFALQATMMGWHAHGMVGVDMARAASELNVPQSFRVEAVYAIGRKGDPTRLSEALRAREQPSPRLPLDELAFEGGFPS